MPRVKILFDSTTQGGDRWSALLRKMVRQSLKAASWARDCEVSLLLVDDPTILLADEPTGNLDADLTVDILTLLSDANARGTTVVVATHDQYLLASHPRRTLVLSGGRVVAGGDRISSASTQENR